MVQKVKRDSNRSGSRVSVYIHLLITILIWLRLHVLSVHARLYKDTICCMLYLLQLESLILYLCCFWPPLLSILNCSFRDPFRVPRSLQFHLFACSVILWLLFPGLYARFLILFPYYKLHFYSFFVYHVTHTLCVNLVYGFDDEFARQHIWQHVCKTGPSAPCYRPQSVSITRTDVLVANPAEESHSYVLIVFSVSVP